MPLQTHLWYNDINYTRMKQKLLLSILVLAGVAIAATGAYAFQGRVLSPVYSDASIGSPATPSVVAPTGFKLAVMDSYCTDQEQESALVTPGGSAVGTDSNSKDPDCASIYFDPGNVGSSPFNSGIYQQDFRIGISMAERSSDCTGEATAIQWTPWASLNGGASKNVSPKNRNKIPDCLWLHYQTRPMPAGIAISDARVGLKVGKGKIEYTPSARNGGGWAEYSQTPYKASSNTRTRIEPNLNPSKVYLQVKRIKTKNR